MNYLRYLFFLLLAASCQQKIDYNLLPVNQLKTLSSNLPGDTSLLQILERKMNEYDKVDSLARQFGRKDSIEAFNQALDSINETLYIDKALASINSDFNLGNYENKHTHVKTNIKQLDNKFYEYSAGTDTLVYITGHINGKADNFIRVSQARPFKTNYQATLMVNDYQDFERNITIKAPGYYQLQHRKNVYDIFLAPGDSVEVLIDHSTDHGLEFLGKTKDVNNYLRCKFLQDKAMKPNEIDLTHQKYESFEKQVSHLKSVRQTSLTKMLNSDNVSVPKAFVEHEKTAINFAWARKHLKYQIKNMDNSIATKRSDGRYFNEIKFKSSDFFNVKNYIKFIYEYFDFFSEKHLEDTYGKEGKYQFDVEERALKRYNRINFFFKDEQVREILKVHLVYNIIGQLKQPSVNPLVIKLRKDITDQEYLNLIEEQYYKYVSIDDGAFAPDFEAKDRNGSALKIDDLKGKWTYIAVWATWCAPCKIEQPHLEILKKDYASKSNLKILSISIDKEQSRWENALDTWDNISEPQYIAPGNWNSSFVEAFNLNSVPKYILIDPDGQINDLSAAKPSADIRIKFDHLGI